MLPAAPRWMLLVAVPVRPVGFINRRFLRLPVMAPSARFAINRRWRDSFAAIRAIRAFVFCHCRALVFVCLWSPSAPYVGTLAAISVPTIARSTRPSVQVCRFCIPDLPACTRLYSGNRHSKVDHCLTGWLDVHGCTFYRPFRPASLPRVSALCALAPLRIFQTLP